MSFLTYLKPQNWTKAILPTMIGCLSSLLLPQSVNATVEGGALVKGTTFSDGTTVVPAHNATSKAIKWNQLDYDTTAFDFNSSTPTFRF